jgi:predicted PurR-regulated permease PerM
MNAPDDRAQDGAGKQPPRPVNPANILVRAEWARLRLWQIQFVRDIAALVLVFGILWLGYELSVVTVPLLLAIFIAYLVEPLVKRAVRGGRVSRQGVAGGIIAAVALGVVLPLILALAVAVVQGVQYVAAVGQGVTLLVQSAVNDPSNLTLRSDLEAKGPLWIRVRDYLVIQEQRYQKTQQRGVKPAPTPSDVPVAVPTLAEEAKDGSGVMGLPTSEQPSDVYSVVRAALKWVEQNAGTLGGKVVQGGTGVAGVVAGFAAGTAGRVGNLVFAAFLTSFFFFFVCTGWGRVLRFWQSLIPERKQGRVFALVRMMDEVIAGFVRGRLTICAILMVFFTVGYWFIGVPAPLVMGPLMGVLALIPYAQGIGAPASMLFMALQPVPGYQGTWWWIVAAPLGMLAVAQFLDDYVLTPRIQGKSTNMDTPTILFASIAGGTLAGIYGLLVAIPVAACIKILLREAFWPRFKAWAEGRERDFLPLER